MHYDELRRRALVRRQIGFEKLHLGGHQGVAAAVIEHSEMRATVVEPVVQGARGVLAEQGGRGFAPDVVIAGSEIERDLAIGRQCDLKFAPLRFGRGVVHPLDHVPNGQYERGIRCRDLAPHTLPHTGRGFAGAIAHNREAELAGRGGPSSTSAANEHNSRSRFMPPPDY